MSEIDFPEFKQAFASYWGRRSLGIVLDDGFAVNFSRDDQSILAFYSRWAESVEAFPAQSVFRLMGTPSLTPELVLRRHGSVAAPPSPPPAAVGRYAVIDGVAAATAGSEPAIVPAVSKTKFVVIVIALAVFSLPLGVFSLILSLNSKAPNAIALGAVTLLVAVSAEVISIRMKVPVGVLRISRWVSIVLALCAILFALLGVTMVPTPATGIPV